jgi:gliding motility-associated-like protein
MKNSQNALLLLFFTLLFSSYSERFLSAQSSSFQLKIDTLLPNPAYFHDVAINEHDEILLLIGEALGIATNPFYGYYIVPVSGQPGHTQAINFNYDFPYRIFFTINSFFRQRKIILNTHQIGLGPNDSRDVVTSIDLSTGENWSRRINGLRQGGSIPFGFSATADQSGNTFLANGFFHNFTTIPTPYPNKKNIVETYKIDLNGTIRWKKGLLLYTSYLPGGNRIKISKIGISGSGDIFYAGHFSLATPFKGPDFIVKTDSLGNPVKWRLLKNLFAYDMLVTDDGIFIWDKIPGGNAIQWYYLANINPSKTKVLKLDHDLNFVWAKQYSAENFNYLTASLIKTKTGKLMMGHTTFGNFPVVLTELNEQGNILSQKGYPNYEPVITAMNDGSLLLVSPKATSTQYSQTPIIAKTDANGNIVGCPTFNTCIQAQDISIEFDTFQIDTFSIFDMEEVGLELHQTTATFQPYCDYPPVPIPNFTFPDTLCLGDSAVTQSDGNRLAQAREWHLTGPNVDSIVQDSFEFFYAFTQPGKYVLRQSVWVLGCRKDYERSITILPPLEVTIEGDSLFCPDEPPLLAGISNRAANFLWSDGQQGPAYAVWTSGNYAITVSDGYCTASDTAFIQLVKEIPGIETPIRLPADTTLCDVHFPFILKPASDFGNSFFLDGEPALSETLTLTKPGTYQVGLNAFGCNFFEPFQLASSECDAAIYLPTIFSPNNDGINDEFYPMGQDFETLELLVFDRWGGLRYRGEGPDARWDGGEAGQGVYTWFFTCRNTLTGEQQHLEGSVTIVR